MEAAAPTLPGSWPAPVVVERPKWTLPDFLDAARVLLDGYFAVEDPSRLEPAERESLISAVVDDQLLIRGYIDRLDVSPDGALRVVDYKTGGAPREAFEARALFQLKFYALVLWRTRGVVPRVLRLLYLKDQEVLRLLPRRRRAGPLRAHARGAVAGDRRGHRGPRTSGPSRAGCAAGARTRRCARRSAARRRRSPTRPRRARPTPWPPRVWSRRPAPTRSSALTARPAAGHSRSTRWSPHRAPGLPAQTRPADHCAVRAPERRPPRPPTAAVRATLRKLPDPAGPTGQLTESCPRRAGTGFGRGRGPGGLAGRPGSGGPSWGERPPHPRGGARFGRGARVPAVHSG